MVVNGFALSGCFGKTQYLAKADALRVIQHRMRTRRVKLKGRGGCTVYRCEQCKSWHIGSRSQ